MNPRDAIVTALTKGSPFNPKGHTFVSTRTLTQYACCEANDVLGLIAGDLAEEVVTKPNLKNPQNGPLCALKANVPEEDHGAPPIPGAEVGQVHAMGGNAIAANVPAVEQEDDFEGAGAPAIDQECAVELPDAPEPDQEAPF